MAYCTLARDPTIDNERHDNTYLPSDPHLAGPTSIYIVKREACSAGHQASNEVRSVHCHSLVVASNPGSDSRLSPVVDSTFEQSEEVAIIYTPIYAWWAIYSLPAVRCVVYTMILKVSAAFICQYWTAHYKMEWIYTFTKIRGQGNLELALETRKFHTK